MFHIVALQECISVYATL